MTRMTPCKAKAVPPLVTLEDIHLPISSNKLQAAVDSSSVQVAVGQEASHSISMVVAAIESRLQSQGHVFFSQAYDDVTDVYSLFHCIITYCMF